MAKFTFDEIDFDTMADWCEKNGYLDWLENEVNKDVTVKRHTKRIKKVDDNGNLVKNTKGKQVWVADKSSPVKEFKVPMDFMTLKCNFYDKFGNTESGLNLLPADFKKEAKKKKSNLRSRIAARKAK